MSLRPPLSNTSAPRDREPDEKEAELLQKFQKERIARRLRGEYESEILRLNELIGSNLDSPAYIASVRVDDALWTRPGFLGWLIQPHLKSQGDRPQTLGGAIYTTRAISDTLMRTDIFASLTPRLERSRSDLAPPNALDLILTAKERGRLHLKSATEVGNGEGSASATGRIRNAFGGAETLEGHVSLGTATRRAFSLSLGAPLTSSLHTRGELSVYASERDYTSFASCREGVRGLRAAVRSGPHEFAYEAVVRHIRDLAQNASVAMRREAGYSVKSALSHTWIRDTRDRHLAASRGYNLKSFQELAGLGGDISFYKSDFQAHFAQRLFRGTSASVSLRTGLLWPLGGVTSTSKFSDRFQLGGPTSVRMFHYNSMGPRDSVDAVGGELSYSAGLSLISDLPWKPHWPLKSHLFVNVGRLDRLDRSQTFTTNVVDSLSKPSVSAGVGLLYTLDPIRVEINLGVPLVAAKTDLTRKGVQVGIGVDFL